MEFKKATAEYQVMQLLQDSVFDGWPNTKAKLPVDIRPYWTYRDEVSCVDGLLFKGNKLVVPHALRAQMLDKIHESHQGIVKCEQRTCDKLFWPGMSAQIEDRVAKCDTCSQYQRAHAKEPMVVSETPDRPWAKGRKCPARARRQKIRCRDPSRILQKVLTCVFYIKLISRKLRRLVNHTLCTFYCSETESQCQE